MAQRLLLLALTLGVLGAACGRADDEQQLRVAFESMRTALLDRDYSTVWDFMDSGSREALAKQLRDLQGVEPGTAQHAAAAASLKELGLSVEQVKDLDAGEYFVAILEGLDRVQPDLRERQLEETRARTVTELTVDGDRAEMTTMSPSGAAETFTWVREGSGWKCKATSVGEGIR